MSLQRFLPIVLAVVSAVGVASCKKSTPTGPGTNSNGTRIIGVSGNLTFGNVAVGQSANLNMTITNTGTSTLTVTGLSVPTGFASVYTATFTSGTIAAGGSQAVTIKFAPIAAQTYNGTLTVNADQTSGSNTLSIAGTGTVLKANIQPGSGGTFTCVTGVCTSIVYPISNLGPGCATNVSVVTRAFGGDGAGPQLGVDIPMGLQGGGSLQAVQFKVGTTVTLQNLGSFNDVRSAHTVFSAFITSTDVPCQ